MFAARVRFACAASLLAAAAAAPDASAGAQARTRPTPAKPDSVEKPDSSPAPGGPFDRLHFRSIGPATMSGRIDDIAVSERDPRIFYIAAATGGLWKTTNNGVTLTQCSTRPAWCRSAR